MHKENLISFIDNHGIPARVPLKDVCWIERAGKSMRIVYVPQNAIQRKFEKIQQIGFMRPRKSIWRNAKQFRESKDISRPGRHGRHYARMDSIEIQLNGERINLSSLIGKHGVPEKSPPGWMHFKDATGHRVFINSDRINGINDMASRTGSLPKDLILYFNGTSDCLIITPNKSQWAELQNACNDIWRTIKRINARLHL